MKRFSVADPGKILTVKEAAQYLRCSVATIYRLMHRGQLHGWKFASDWRFNVEEIERFRWKR